MKTAALSLLLLFVPWLAPAQPVIRFETEQHDFGHVRPGSQPEFAFQVTNDGDQPLDILDVGTS